MDGGPGHDALFILKEQTVDNPVLVVVGISIPIVVALWVIGGWLDRWSAFRCKATGAEFQRLLNQRPEAAAAYQRWEAEARMILRQMGKSEIALDFFA